jgi:hypothetical protein
MSFIENHYKLQSNVQVLIDGYNLITIYGFSVPVTVAARSKAWTVYERSDAEIMGSNPTQGMDVWCVIYVYSVFVLSCV